jgi:hypothetical protein
VESLAALEVLSGKVEPGLTCTQLPVPAFDRACNDIPTRVAISIVG